MEGEHYIPGPPEGPAHSPAPQPPRCPCGHLLVNGKCVASGIPALPPQVDLEGDAQPAGAEGSD